MLATFLFFSFLSVKTDTLRFRDIKICFIRFFLSWSKKIRRRKILVLKFTAFIYRHVIGVMVCVKFWWDKSIIQPNLSPKANLVPNLNPKTIPNPNPNPKHTPNPNLKTRLKSLKNKRSQMIAQLYPISFNQWVIFKNIKNDRINHQRQKLILLIVRCYIICILYQFCNLTL